MSDKKTSVQSIQRTSRIKRAALHRVRVDHGRAYVGAEAVMLHPNNPAHSVKEVFSHDGNPSGINTIRPKTSRLGHRRKRKFRVGKTEEFCRKLSYICSSPGSRLKKNRNLSGHIEADSVIKEQVVLLFAKDSTCRILFSYVL